MKNFKFYFTSDQCSGSGAKLNPDSVESVDPDPGSRQRISDPQNSVVDRIPDPGS
jgi:hypothetical protein